VSMVGTATEVGPGQAPPPRRVVLLSESGGLAVLLRHLLGGGDRLHRFASLGEALDHQGLLDADTVLLDLPGEAADTAVAHVRHHWKGPLVVLADRGRPRPDVPLQPAWTFLTRPFSVQDLAAALGLAAVAPTGPATDIDPAAETGPAAGTGPEAGVGPAAEVAAAWAAARQAAIRPVAGGASAIKGAGRLAPTWVQAAADRVGAAGLVDRALGALADFAEAWRERRRVRVAGFSLLTLLAFATAFALAAQDRCGPACGAFGTGFEPLPTVAPGGPGEPGGPATTAPRRAPASTAATAGGASGTGAFAGASGGRLATTTTVPRATTTTRGSGGGAPGPTTPPTRPPTTPTTEPPTTPTTQGTPTTTTIGLPGLPLP
jgi:hypothetical protein